MKTQLFKYLLVSCLFLLFANRSFGVAITVTGNNSTSTNGITAGTLSYGQTGIVLYGFTITTTAGSPLITSFQLAGTRNWSSYFGNYSLVTCSTTNYSTGTKTAIGGSLAFSPSGTSLTITGFGQNIPSGTSVNYFLVADFSVNGSNNLTFQVNNFNNVVPGSASITTTIDPTANTGNIFSIPPPAITVTGNNAIGSPPSVPTGNGISTTTLTFGQTGVVFYGFSLTDANAPTTITAVNLYANNPIAAWCTNFKLYSSPTTVFNIATATLMSGATITTTSGNTLFQITGLSETFMLGQSRNYFIVADFTTVATNIALPNTTQFGTSNVQVTSSVANTTTTNSSIAGQIFNLSSPILTISNYSPGVYTGSTVAPGGTYNLLGFTLSYSGPINMHILKIDLNFASGSNFTSGYVSSVNLVDASTGTTAAHVTQFQNNATQLWAVFDGTALSTTTNYYVQVTFISSFSVHEPGTFTVCLNASSNPASGACQNESSCIVNDTYVNSNGTACSNNFVGQAIYDWIGTTLSTGDQWNLATNWSPAAVPGSVDIARIGVANGFNKLPVLYTGSTTTNVGEIIFGSSTSGTFTSSGVTVNSGYTLNVNGDIIMQSDAHSADRIPNDPVNLAGAGTIKVVNLDIISSNTANFHAFTQVLNTSVNKLILSGNIALSSDYNTTFTLPFNSTFNLTGGTTTVNGILQSTNTTAGCTSTFEITPSSTATLQLANVAALSGLSATVGTTNVVTFTNAGSTVEYSGAAQTVYTDQAITGLATGPTYNSLKFSGTGIKTPNGGNLSMTGDFTNTLANDVNNYINLTTTPVFFTGTTESLAGGLGAGTTFYNVNFSGIGKKSMASGYFNVASTGTLNMLLNKNTILAADAGGLLTLNSDVNGSASVTSMSGNPSITGNVNVQRYLTGGSTIYRSYRLLSSPVNISSSILGTGNLSLSYINTNVTAPATAYGALTGGPSGATNGFNVASSFPTLYLYDEGRTTLNSFTQGKDVGINSVSSASATTISAPGYPSQTINIPVGNGYFMYFVGNNQSTITATNRVPENTTITSRGYLNQGPINFTLWTGASTLSFASPGGTKGFNLIGNPYPSTIDLMQLYKDNKTQGYKIFYMLSNVDPGQSYSSYNGKSGASNSGSPSEYIASGQGFFVLATAAGQTLTFTENEKVTTQVNAASSPAGVLTIRKSGQITDAIAVPGIQPDNIAPQPENVLTGLHLSLTDGLINTSCGIYFSNDDSDNFDNDDAPVLTGMGQNDFMSSFTADGVNTSINSMATYTNGKRVKLYVKAATDGIYNINMTDFQNIDTTVFNIYLIDKVQKDSLDMVRYKSYAFNLSTADTSAFANRFVLVIERRPLAAYELISFTAQANGKDIPVTWKTYNEGDYTGFVLQKQDPATGRFTDQIDSLQSNGSNNYSFTDTHPTTGANVYRLKQYDINGQVTYSQLVMVLYNTTVKGDLLIYPNPAHSTITVNVNQPAPVATYVYSVYNMSGELIGQKSSNTSTWIEDVSSYKAGIYVIVLKDNSGNLIGKSKFVKVD